MAEVPQIPTPWKATAGSPFAAVVKIADGAPVAGKAWRSQLRKSARNTEVAAEFAINAVDGTGADEGKAVLSLTLTGAVTRELAGKSFVFDLEETIGVSEPVTLMGGELEVDHDVTRA